MNNAQQAALREAIGTLFDHEPVAVGTAVSMAVTGTLTFLSVYGVIDDQTIGAIAGLLTLWLPVIRVIVRSRYALRAPGLAVFSSIQTLRQRRTERLYCFTTFAMQIETPLGAPRDYHNVMNLITGVGQEVDKEGAMQPASPYPVRFSVDYPDRPLNRLTTFFRLITVIPIAILAGLLSGSSWEWTTDTGRDVASSGQEIVIGGVGLLVIPVALMIIVRQKYPRWWFDWNLGFPASPAGLASIWRSWTTRIPPPTSNSRYISMSITPTCRTISTAGCRS
ncbi:MAG: hypothetical protein R2839_09285 [Thermomicrobiales bacterium]